MLCLLDDALKWATPGPSTSCFNRVEFIVTQLTCFKHIIAS